eukprot:scaffold1178_cov252-Pinguiococcus_pyrenoidosus.AAC.15
MSSTFRRSPAEVTDDVTEIRRWPLLGPSPLSVEPIFATRCSWPPASPSVSSSCTGVPTASAGVLLREATLGAPSAGVPSSSDSVTGAGAAARLSVQVCGAMSGSGPARWSQAGTLGLVEVCMAAAARHEGVAAQWRSPRGAASPVRRRSASVSGSSAPFAPQIPRAAARSLPHANTKGPPARWAPCKVGFGGKSLEVVESPELVGSSSFGRKSKTLLLKPQSTTEERKTDACCHAAAPWRCCSGGLRRRC